MKRILWVDDEPWTIAPEKDRLEMANYHITMVSSVASALKGLDEGPDYDAIVIDVINRPYAVGEEPDSDIAADAPTRTLGLVFGEIVREHPKYRDVPLVFYTVVDDPKVRARIQEMGGRYVPKRDSLVAEIESMFEETKQ